MEQFSLEKYIENPNSKVVTRRGNPVRIICTDRKHGEDDLPIVFLEECHNGEFLLACRKDGRSDTYDTPYDLFFADEKKELTEFEEKLVDLVSGWCDSHLETPEEYINKHSQTLLDLARKEIEKEIIKEVEQKVINNTYAYQNGYENGKQDALKDLPKWRRDCFFINITSVVDDRLYYNGYYIDINELEKLPKQE